MTQLENRRPVSARPSDGDTPAHDPVTPDHVPHSGGPIIHRDDSWREEIFDRDPGEFDPH